MDEAADGAEGECVADAIEHLRSVAVGDEAVGVVPEFVGAAEFDVGEGVGRVPVDDFSFPVDGDAVEFDAVTDLSAFDDVGGGDGEDFETDPGRRDGFKILGVGEKFKDIVDGAREPLFLAEGMKAHVDNSFNDGSGECNGRMRIVLMG